MKVFFSVLLASVASGAFAGNLIFRLDGEVKATFKIANFVSGRVVVNGDEIGSVDKTLFNAWRQYERTYRGYAFYELMDAVHGKKWRKAKKIVFVALDGYRQTSGIKDMLDASRKKNGYVAFTETGKKGFSKFKRGGKTVEPRAVLLGLERLHPGREGETLGYTQVALSVEKR